MLIIECFYNRQRYISPEEEIIIYYEVHNLMKIWKNIILKYSNNRITDLSPENQEILRNIIPYLKNLNFNEEKSIAIQLDRIIISIILWGASNFFTQKDVVDEIFKKTKSSMFQYFHYDLIIKAYLKLNLSDKAIEVIKYMFEKDHIAYLYAITKYKTEHFKNKKFLKKLSEYKRKAILKLLSKGEKVDLLNVSYTDLVNIVNQTKHYITEDLTT